MENNNETCLVNDLHKIIKKMIDCGYQENIIKDEVNKIIENENEQLDKLFEFYKNKYKDKIVYIKNRKVILKIEDILEDISVLNIDKKTMTLSGTALTIDCTEITLNINIKKDFNITFNVDITEEEADEWVHIIDDPSVFTYLEMEPMYGSLMQFLQNEND